MNSLTPVSSSDRILELDILRGFALFGILMVNIQYFGIPFLKVLTDMHPFTDTASMIGRAFVVIVFEGKFITLFSFLFGLGFWIFISRARDKGKKAGPLFLRRLLILTCMGAIHATLFWAGDILLIYALLGLFLMVFINRKTGTIKVWMFLFPTIQFVLFLLLVFMVHMGMQVPEAREQILQSFQESQTMFEEVALSTYTAYRSSNWAAMIPVRLSELNIIYYGFLFSSIGIFYLLGIFLAGVLAGRNGWFSQLDQKLPAIKKKLVWLLPYGMACSVIHYFFYEKADLIIPDLYMAGYLFFFFIGTPALTASYGMLLILAYHHWKDSAFWSYPGSAGRMSLTIYLTQTLIFTTIFYGYGLGLLSKVAVVP
ncbi:DUF418 domain-containing protein, partial [Balneolaceae bacterium ANBcel3]|nr:DUF418 domain-containing protein [Balneolaceae bacterium ANBcel3]